MADLYDDVETAQIAPAASSGAREVALDTLVARRTSPRMRILQASVLLTLVVVVGGLVFRGYQAAQPRPQPTTAVAFEDYSMNVAIDSNINYGTLTVNGKTLDAHLPVIVTLHEGMNTITLSTPPFQPHTCTFDMSRSSVAGAQCGAGGGTLWTIGGKKALTAVIVPLTLADLPAAKRPGVEAVVAQAIDSLVVHTTVPARQYIATGVDAHGHITSRLTDEQLQAELSVVRRPDQAPQMDSTCVENICALEIISPSQSSPSNADSKVWKVASVVSSQWRFIAPTGDVVAASSPRDMSGPDPRDAFVSVIEVALKYDGVGGWTPQKISDFASDASPLPSALTIMEYLQCMAAGNVLDNSITPDAGHQTSTRANGIEGCELQALDSSDQPIASFIWRFGVLLAADPGAHKMIPSLPVAPQAEIDAVVPNP